MNATTFFLMFGVIWLVLFCIVLPLVRIFSKDKSDYSKSNTPSQPSLLFPWWNM